MAIADDEIEKLIEEVAKYPHLYIVKGDYKVQVKRKKFLEPDIKHFEYRRMEWRLANILRLFFISSLRSKKIT